MVPCDINIGDIVKLKDIRYDKIKLEVAGVDCRRIMVHRKDAHGMVWSAYVDVDELMEI